jgi:hypothetical protein
MDNIELNESLAKLREELKTVTQVDDPAREAMKRLDDDIHRILQNPDDVPPAHHASLRESLAESVDIFETTHPTLTSFMSRLLKALSDMGI